MSVRLARLGSDVVRPPWTRQRLQFPLLSLVVFVLFLVAVSQTGVSIGRLFGSFEAVGNLLERMWPPVTFEWPRYLAAIRLTFFMVVAATGLALVMSIPFAILSARNTTVNRTTFAIARGVVVFTRAVPSIVWALLLVRAIGIGPLAGVLAMAISSVGMLGKLFADTIEDVDRRPLEALAANGSGPAQVFISGILPQVVTAWISLTLFRLDINVRRSIILGFVGAGGIGFELQRVLGQLVYRRGLTIIAMIFVFIAVIEQLSGWARKVLVGNEGPGQNPWKGPGRRKAGPAAVARSPEQKPEMDSGSGVSGDTVRVPWTRLRFFKVVSLGIGSVLVVVSMAVVNLTPASFVSAWVKLGGVARRMFPPDFLTNWEGIAVQMLETVWIALAATVLGMAIALPVAILAARNTTPRRWVSVLARGAMLVQRGVPELILAVLFVVAVGLGPFAGVLALTVGAIGFTGKLLADGFETLPDNSLVALTSVGANWWQRISGGLLPQAMPMIAGIGIYTLDVYIRAAAILGIVGAGGIGGILNSTIQSHSYDRTFAIVLIIFALIYGFERLAGWARKRLI
ncbi:MAG: phosphonate ABC transporter, permease protein PhnE [Acidimicrobiia bacterium]